MRTRLTVLTALVLALCGSFAQVAGAQPSSPPAPTIDNPTSGHYCTTIVDRDDATKVTSIVSRTCSKDRDDPRLNPDQQQGVAASAARAILITVFEDAGWIGYYDNVYGQDGPCDSSGYGFTDLRALNAYVNGITSYYYYNNCDAQQYYTSTYYGGTRSAVRYGDRYNVGSPWNDHLWSMRVWNG